MNLDTFVRVVDKLTYQTQNRETQWEEGPFPDSYFTNVGKNGVAIRNFEGDYLIYFFNQDGDIVESISDNEFMESGIPLLENLSSLYRLAQRNSKGADRVIEEIAKDLEI